MNVQQFAKLKTGDLFQNGISGSTGEVVDVDASGVRVKWLAAGSDKNNAPTWHYSVHSTAWFHWRELRFCPHGDKVECTAPERCKHGDDNFQCLGGDYDAIARGI